MLIAGPTASGKSSVAVQLAETFGGVVINADSMQVYDTLRVLTARPGAADEARVPHVMYGHTPFATPDYSTGRWLSEATAAIEAAERAGQLPILVGGTGLYFKALTEGFAEIPPIPEGARNQARAVARKGVPAIREALRQEDPAVLDRIDRDNPHRMARALEVKLGTGRSILEWQAETPPPFLPLEGAAGFVLAPPREFLHQRIASRFETMLEQGALEEATVVQALSLDPLLPAMKALGLPQLIEYINGKRSREEAIELSIIASRQYARRQSTWFRNQMIAWNLIFEQDSARKTAQIIGKVRELDLTAS